MIAELKLQLEDLFSVKTKKIVPMSSHELGLLDCWVDFQEALSVDASGSDVSKLPSTTRVHLAFFHREGTRTASPLTKPKFPSPFDSTAVQVPRSQLLAVCPTLFHGGERADSLCPAHPSRKVGPAGSTFGFWRNTGSLGVITLHQWIWNEKLEYLSSAEQKMQ